MTTEKLSALRLRLSTADQAPSVGELPYCIPLLVADLTASGYPQAAL
jgi:hypothetical protein